MCRGEDCRAFGTARFGFTTDDEWISHWNTFHVAVMPQFVCQQPGCGTTFAADPGALDRFLDHTTRRRKEEAAAGILFHQRHPILPDTTSLELWPNPYFRPPNMHDEVPQRLGDVKAPLEDLDCRNPEDRVLRLRWTFRRLFGKRIEQALIGATEAAAKKRQRTDTPVQEIINPEKRAKSNHDQDREEAGAASDLGCADPRDSFARCKPKLEMTPAVRLECFKLLERGDEVKRIAEKTGDAAGSNTTGPSPKAMPQESVSTTSSRSVKTSGISAKGANPAEAMPPSKTKRQRLDPPSSDVLSTRFRSALHPRSQTEWDRLCSATDYEKGQLRGNVGTPDEPLFTYEEAVRQRVPNKISCCPWAEISSPQATVSSQRYQRKL